MVGMNIGSIFEFLIYIVVIFSPIYLPFFICFIGEYFLMKLKNKKWHFIIFIICGILLVFGAGCFLNIIPSPYEPAENPFDDNWKLSGFLILLGSAFGIAGAGVIFIVKICIKWITDN